MILSLIPPWTVARRPVTIRMVQFFSLYVYFQPVVEIFPERHHHTNPPPVPFVPLDLNRKIRNNNRIATPSYDRQMLQRGWWFWTVSLSPAAVYHHTCTTAPVSLDKPLNERRPDAFLSYSFWCVQGDFFFA